MDFYKFLGIGDNLPMCLVKWVIDNKDHLKYPHAEKPNFGRTSGNPMNEETVYIEWSLKTLESSEGTGMGYLKQYLRQ